VTSLGGEIGSYNNSGVGLGKITVEGTGSTWSNAASFAIGDVGRPGAGELEIINGGHVASVSAGITSSSVAPSKVSVDGVSSSWDIGTHLIIGYPGRGNPTDSRAKLSAVQQFDRTGAAAQQHALARFQPLGRLSHRHHRWQSHFAGSDGAMRKRPAAIGDQAGGLKEQGRPGWRSGRRGLPRAENP
jgi:T5SS/PEP-CTERM-associated repeat protein